MDRDLEDPFAAFGLDTETDADATILATVDLWIVNDAREAIVVRAEAGAEAVLVDTVLARDSSRVRLESSADSILVSAVGPSGALMGQTWVRMDTSVVRTAFP